MHIQIIGAGLSGLVCAHYILDKQENTQISIYELRAEIGYPQHKPGIINEFERYQNNLKKWGFTELTQCFTVDGRGGLHRPQLEKDLSIKLTQRGANIYLKTRIEGISNNQQGHPSLQSKGAGPNIANMEVNTIIDTTGIQSPLASFDQRIHILQQTTFPWIGGISISNDVPNIAKWSSKRLDGTFEHWFSNEKIDLEYNWLSIMEGEFSEEDAFIDSSIQRGMALASLALERM
uniref:Uncharacterized protein n=1 Tax=uncultured marine group II/III euryarchaeote KM3_115_A12 TaxID=1457854 RepID=A0A075G8D5_9EURY|nr:hypothetical protein [uncultured marine group II/III euryarchaeote KM3_115_A12]